MCLLCLFCLMPTKTTHLVSSYHSKGTSRSWSKAQPWTWPTWSCLKRNPDILLHTRYGAQRALSIFPLIMMLSKMPDDRGICSEICKCTPGDSHRKWVDLCSLHIRLRGFIHIHKWPVYTWHENRRRLSKGKRGLMRMGTGGKGGGGGHKQNTLQVQCLLEWRCPYITHDHVRWICTTKRGK